jgi:hypothetical protein
MCIPKTFSGVINIETKNQDYQTAANGDFIKKIESQRPPNRKFYFGPIMRSRQIHEFLITGISCCGNRH